MPVEMRLEDPVAPTPNPAPPPEGPAPAALRDLIAARLVSHEVIGDPARCAREATTLQALCRLVAGPVYRLEPFHYAFMLRDDDLDGAIGPLAAPARIEALDAALAAELGPEALWLGETGLLSEATDGPAGAAVLPEAALVVLRARDAAVTGGLAAADPTLRAVIDARFAAETARHAAEFGAALGQKAATEAAAALECRMSELEARLEALFAERLERRDAAQGAGMEAASASARAFETRLGLMLAEFLARLERRSESGAPTP